MSGVTRIYSIPQMFFIYGDLSACLIDVVPWGVAEMAVRFYRDMYSYGNIFKETPSLDNPKKWTSVRYHLGEAT